MSLSVAYLQGSATAATGEWRNRLYYLKSQAHHSIMPSDFSARISAYTEATQSLLTWELQ